MPTWLVDRNGFVFGYRTDIPEWMQKIVVVDGHTMTLLSKIAVECKDYMEACGDISDTVSGKNRRGPHWFHVSGVDRQISFVRKMLFLLAFSSHTFLEAKVHQLPYAA